MKAYLSAAPALLKSRRFWLILLGIFSTGVIAAFLFQALIMALLNGYGVNTFATNGTFQLYNPLQRLSEGQIAGYDFPFFHGIGVVLVHFPMFFLLGENVFAAEAAKHFMSPLIFVLTSLIFFWAFFKNIHKSLIATALLIPLCLAMIDVVWPGNSLVGLRSALPVLAIAAVFWNSPKRFHLFRLAIPLTDILVVLLLSLSFVCGVEQGVAGIVAYILLKGIIYIKHKQHFMKSALSIGGLVIGMSITIFVLFTILTLGHPLEPLRYALVDIPSDQGWYFGAPPNPYATWDNLIPILLSEDLLMNHNLRFIYLVGGIALIMLLIAWRSKALSAIQKRGLLFMALTGIIVCGAGVIGGYYAPQIQLLPLARFGALVAVTLLVSFAFSDTLWTTAKKKTKSLIQNPTLRTFLLTILLLAFSAQLISSLITHIGIIRSYNVKATFEHIQVAKKGSDYSVSSPEWKKRLDSFKRFIHQGDSVWSMYTSLYDSSIESLNPSRGGEDYIIHALGKQRRESYEEQFMQSNSKYVITLKPTYFMYEEWLWSRHWKMYEFLLTHYSLVSTNDSHLLWRLTNKDQPLPSSPSFGLVENAHGRYVLPANTTNRPKIYTLTITYDTRTRLPANLLKNIPRYLVDYHDTASVRYPAILPPGETTWTIPVVVLPGEDKASIDPRVDGLLPFAKLSVQNIQAQELAFPVSNDYLFLNNYCSFSKQNQSSDTCKAMGLKPHEQ